MKIAGSGRAHQPSHRNGPLLCSISDAAAMLSIGRSKMYELISEGKVTTVSIGRRRLVRCESIRALALDEAA
jgi:excisionase family DNA binding protein